MPTLGKGVEINLPVLLESKLLVQANSGAGKSWLLRRLLEQTAGKVQQIVIDPEGEFNTLREKHDFIIAAPHDGDALAHPHTAKLLARRLLETGVSAIVDIYDLKAHERHTFVRIFLDALVNAPKKLWHPALIVLDEAHMFAPEKGKSEALGSVIDIATRGRKRGQCLVAATQRLAKLHKDVAAELLNKAIGRTGLDIDVKRVADELGMSPALARQTFRSLSPGKFHCFGPALSQEVVECQIGRVKTTHPKAGQRLMQNPPAPSSAIKKILAELADLPKEAEQEALTIGELKRESANLRREATGLRKQLKINGVPEKEVQKRINNAVRELRNSATTKPLIDTKHTKILQDIHRIAGKALNNTQTHSGNIAPVMIARAPRDLPAASGINGLRSGTIRILQELASRYPAGYSKPQVGTLTKFKHTGGTFGAYIGDLKKNGYIEVRDKLIHATESGIEALGSKIPASPKTHDEVMVLWRTALRSGAYSILEIIVEAGELGIDKEDIAIRINMSFTGGTFGAYLGDLTKNGLATKNNGIYIASNLLFPGG